ncbi:MAG: hypothetical protein SFY92_12930 [Verrucomicrobiae bacterium]|nr:hypothetical protein [Verrucomicrobiae bacterium]
MIEKLLTIEDGTYSWTYENFVAHTHHEGGRIVWAKASGLQNHYEGLPAILRIVSNPEVACNPITKPGDLQQNIEGDWDLVKREILRQMDLSRKFHARKSKLENLWVKVLDIPSDLEPGPAKDLLLSIPQKTFPVKNLTMYAPEFALWLLTDLEMRNVVKIFEPVRISTKKE